MNTSIAARNLARKILGEKETQKGMPVDRLCHVLGRLREVSGLDNRQPVFLRKDEDGLFALLPHEREKDNYSSTCVCWCHGDEDACGAYPDRSLTYSEEASENDAFEMLASLRTKGYTDLWRATTLTQEMHDIRISR